MNEKIPITMKDIARDLGVSIATVSRALKDSPRISAAQKERIQTYAREHNFYPNIIGEALRHSKIQTMKVIGVIVPEFVHYYFMSVLSGIEEEARARGYRVMVAQSNERYDKEVAICDDFYKNKVCGIIVSQAKDTKRYDHFQMLMDNGVPLVFYDRICTGVNCSRVVFDDYMGAYTAVTHLIDTGCKKIAFYGSPMNLEISKNRYNGYHDALVKHGLKELPPTYVFVIIEHRQRRLRQRFLRWKIDRMPSLPSMMIRQSVFSIPPSEWVSGCRKTSVSVVLPMEIVPRLATLCLPPWNSEVLP